MSTSEINLLKRSGNTLRTLTDLEDKLRVIAWWSLVALLAAGIILGTAFFYLSSRSDQLQSQSAQLGRQIDAQLVKEGILTSLKQRADVAKNALDAARPWGNLFPILSMIALPTQLKSISIDESAHVRLTMILGSVDDAVTVVTNMIALSGQHTIRAPQLISFVIKADGTVQMGVSFIPTL